MLSGGRHQNLRGKTDMVAAPLLRVLCPSASSTGQINEKVTIRDGVPTVLVSEGTDP